VEPYRLRGRCRKQGEDIGMKKRSLLAVPILFTSLLAQGQAAPSPGQNIPGPGPAPSSDPNTEKKEPKLGSYHVETTLWAPGSTAHLLSPQPVVELKGATPRVPGDVNGTTVIPDQMQFDSIGKPSFDCTPVSSIQHGCDALDIVRITQVDPKTVAYRLSNHGGAVRIALNIQVRDMVLRSQPDTEQEWHPDEVIFVSVPKPTPSLNVVSETLVGTWDGNAIVFEVGKPLPESAKKGLQDLNVHQDLGDKILYSYKVKSPKSGK
jgi:hypothetical protein